jgi:hypothetical protein
MWRQKGIYAFTRVFIGVAVRSSSSSNLCGQRIRGFFGGFFDGVISY